MNVWADNIFNEVDLNRIEYYCSGNLTDAKVASDKSEYRKEIRESKVKFISRDDENEWIFKKFNDLIVEFNNRYYGFDLYGYDAFQYTVYEGEKKGQYDWHSDLLYGNNLGETLYSSITRKMTLVMLLNDPKKNFTGGEFQVNTGRECEASTIEMRRGTIVAFPSFVLHRVKPVLSGIRKSIVIWVEGPKFR